MENEVKTDRSKKSQKIHDWGKTSTEPTLWKEIQEAHANTKRKVNFLYRGNHIMMRDRSDG